MHARGFLLIILVFFPFSIHVGSRMTLPALIPPEKEPMKKCKEAF